MDQKKVNTWGVRLGALSLVAGMVFYFGWTDSGGQVQQTPVQGQQMEQGQLPSSGNQNGTEAQPAQGANGFGGRHMQGRQGQQQMPNSSNAAGGTTDDSSTTEGGGSQWIPGGGSNSNTAPDGEQSFNAPSDNSSSGMMPDSRDGFDTTTGGS